MEGMGSNVAVTLPFSSLPMDCDATGPPALRARVVLRAGTSPLLETLQRTENAFPAGCCVDLPAEQLMLSGVAT